MRVNLPIAPNEALYTKALDHVVNNSAAVSGEEWTVTPASAETLHNLLTTIGAVATASGSLETSFTATDAPSGSNPRNWFNIAIERTTPPGPPSAYGSPIGRIALWYSSKEVWSDSLPPGFSYNAWYRLFMRDDAVHGVKDEVYIPDDNVPTRSRLSQNGGDDNRFSDTDGLNLNAVVRDYATAAGLKLDK